MNVCLINDSIVSFYIFHCVIKSQQNFHSHQLFALHTYVLRKNWLAAKNIHDVAKTHILFIRTFISTFPKLIGLILLLVVRILFQRVRWEQAFILLHKILQIFQFKFNCIRKMLLSSQRNWIDKRKRWLKSSQMIIAVMNWMILNLFWKMLAEHLDDFKSTIIWCFHFQFSSLELLYSTMSSLHSKSITGNCWVEMYYFIVVRITEFLFLP